MLLKNSLEKERELNELKSRFISTTSHEFRTPLASILSSMQLIQRYRKKWQDEIIDNQFDRIKVSIFNLTSLLDDILTISHADSGKIIFNPQKLNLYKYCMELFEEVKHKANEKHEFIFNYSAKEKEYTLDSKLVRFIIVNLLSNAFKYSPKGGKVILAVSSKSMELQISVKDEGMGISSEDKKQLFKPFFRAKNTKDIEGTGLGLSIVEKAVLMHNGNIKCNSAEGKGTRFMIKIPIR
jgi:signal transduction histidine kinase